ncbi:hypothetical protein [Bradyrhizobium macuxiense]|nr:hypothetical protein [Bradyrhizobium macuxiense]
MMVIGDPLGGVLPPAAHERVEGMKLRLEELTLLYRNAFAEEQAVRLEVLKIEARIAELQRPRGQGGADLDSNDFRVVSERARLDRARGDLNRLLAAQEPRNAESQRIGELLRNIDAAIAARPTGTVGRMVEVEPPPVKGGDVLGAIEARRRRLRELQADLQRTRCAPYPSVDRKRAMIEQVETLAERGRPDATSSIEYAEDVRWPLATHRVDVHNSAGAVGFAQMPDTLALFAWLFRDRLIEQLDREIDECADDDAALNAKARAEQEMKVLADILATEREECALIDLAKKQGLPINHRADINPLALLQIEWVLAPPPIPREDEGLAGVVRHVGP